MNRRNATLAAASLALVLAGCKTDRSTAPRFDLSCYARQEQYFVGETVEFRAVGTGTRYGWLVVDPRGEGDPPSGSGTSFDTSFGNPGTKTVEVEETNYRTGNPDQRAECQVLILAR